MSSVPTTYFEKELLSQPVWMPNGKHAPWEPVGDDQGVVATTDATLIFHLSNLAQRRVGGVIRIDEARYSELKKNTSVSESPRPLQRASVSGITAAPQNLSPFHQPAEAVAPVVVEAVKPPTPAALPARVRTGRAKTAPVIAPI